MTDTLTSAPHVNGVLLEPGGPRSAPLLHISPRTPDALPDLLDLFAGAGLPAGTLTGWDLGVNRPPGKGWELRVLGPQTMDVFMPASIVGQRLVCEGARVPAAWTTRACALGGAILIVSSAIDWTKGRTGRHLVRALERGFLSGLVDVNDLRSTSGP